MLNRTNRTQSATSFGLNLGTRSFAVATRTVLNNGLSTLCSRHLPCDRSADLHPRAGDRMIMRIRPKIMIMGPISSRSNGSPSSVYQGSSEGQWPWSRVEAVVAEAPSSASLLVANVPEARAVGSGGPSRCIERPRALAASKAPNEKPATAATRRAAIASAFGQKTFDPPAHLRAARG